MFQLSSFKIKMGVKNKKLIINRKLGLGIGGILLIAGMLFLFLTKQALISGILAGIGFVILVFYLFMQHRRTTWRK